jgi:hypothetical protein
MYQTANFLQQCQKTVKSLSEILEGVVGKEGAHGGGRRDRIKKQFRMQSKEDELDNIRQKLSIDRDNIHLSLTMLNMFV